MHQMKNASQLEDINSKKFLNNGIHVVTARGMV